MLPNISDIISLLRTKFQSLIGRLVTGVVAYRIDRVPFQSLIGRLVTGGVGVDASGSAAFQSLIGRLVTGTGRAGV